jgi:hypothetical protein
MLGKAEMASLDGVARRVFPMVDQQEEMVVKEEMFTSK